MTRSFAPWGAPAFCYARNTHGGIITENYRMPNEQARPNRRAFLFATENMNGGATVPEEVYDIYDARREIREIKDELREFKSTWRQRDEKKDEKIQELTGRVQQVESDIAGIREQLGEIKGDTSWLRRTITGALITALIGGIIGFFFFLVQNGGA